MQRLAFAIVAPTAVAGVVAWALYGTEGLRAAVGITGSLTFAAGRLYLEALRLRRWWERRRPVKPEDRDRRRALREERRRRRAAV